MVNTVHKIKNVYLMGVVMKDKIFILLFVLISFNTTTGQINSPLEDYIKIGLESNILLKQKHINYDKALIELKNANSLFLPNIVFNTDYTDGKGGRAISIPVGDMLNPVYSTLNQLTGSNAFPNIQNVSEDFLPNNFYDTKIRTSAPIINTDIIYNRQIVKNEVEIKEYEIDLYKKELVKEIEISYYNYLSSLEAVKIYHSALLLVNEAKRVNEALLRNGAGLQAYLLRSESEVAEIQSQLTSAVNQSLNAKRYFNFLLNRNLDEEIIVSNDINIENLDVLDISLDKREEINIMNKAIDISNNILDMKKSYWIPKISGFVDLGSQSSDWKFNKDTKYYLFGFQLSVPIFEGFRNQNGIELSELSLKENELNLLQIKNGLNLSLSIAKNQFLTEKENYNAAEKQLKAAEMYFNLINKGYQAGVNTFIETIDARNQLTMAKTKLNITKYNVLISYAKYKREK